MLPEPTDLTIEEAAARLRLGPPAVRRALREGRLAGYRAGSRWRVPLAALAAYCRPADVPAARRPRLRVLDLEARKRRALASLASEGF